MQILKNVIIINYVLFLPNKAKCVCRRTAVNGCHDLTMKKTILTEVWCEICSGVYGGADK